MSLLAACIGFVLSLLVAAFLRDLGLASTRDTRAQIAADAAALAAVAESGPFGRARPHDAAREYAQRNSGWLVECRCRPGATAMQVTVEIEGVLARARAVIDPEMLAPMQLKLGRESMDPSLLHAVDRLLGAAGDRVFVTSGFRSRAEQQALWRQAVARYGSAEAADDWVARPGTSAHETGLAVDLGGDLALALETIEKLGLPLWRPLANELWHFELTGSRSGL